MHEGGQQAGQSPALGPVHLQAWHQKPAPFSIILQLGMTLHD